MKTLMTEAEKEHAAAMELKKLHDAEIIETADGPCPRSRGKAYPHLGWPEAYTDQTGRDQADINNIMKRFEKTGKLADLIGQGMQAENGMLYGDFTDPVSFQEALNISIHAQNQFNLLDAQVRNRFDNDPVKFLQFMEDPNTMEEQVNMGLRARKPVEEPPVTNKDVVNAINNLAKGSKKAPKGGDSDE